MPLERAVILAFHQALYEPNRWDRITLIRGFDEKALVYNDGPEHGQSHGVKLRVHGDLRDYPGLDGNRASVPLERHLAAGYQHGHEYREHADGVSDPEHSKSGKLRAPAQNRRAASRFGALRTHSSISKI
jgi:hypothetical protein